MKNTFNKYKEYIYIFKALIILTIISAISHFFREHLGIINIALIHIIPVVVVAIHGNIKATVFMTFLSVLCLNFLYIPPLYSFNVNNELYLWSFLIFGVVGLIITIQAKNLITQKKQNELRESLLHIISHDLRTPLSTIHGTINLILSNEKLDNKSLSALLEDINYASLRMKRLITNLLDSTRLSNKNIDLKLEWCDFEDIIGVALNEFSQKQNDEKLSIKIDELALFWGDNTLLTQLIVNLLDNAFKYSKSDTKIDLDVENLNNFIKIKIFNETDYIDKKRLKNIFDKFYRLEDTNDILGSGIGLAICKSIVKLHNGEIKAIAKENGILIEIELPIIKRVNIE
ncbi:PAS domain-containing sensor histidine kinase [Arcobacter lacus]|uniref:sensor histidine kinase n=1 Tax=Arcobacter lacus TaxID=1912876 RepID=UPI0021BAEAA3|nr:PAS domain-containing sensor histidine kinase [Arcobacter lacus]MCT7908840.1 PAS domain-containing sensor histidine kinase [Arcobacter lacus]MCT7911144.1 PAS domain-containing sensor histidine kinase [Arcobacter lacus]